MGTKFRLAIIVALAVVISSMVSHFTVRVLGVRTGGVGHKVLAEGEGPKAIAHGSSLLLDALAWEEVSAELGTGVENWFVAGSSPSEWEPLLDRAEDPAMTIVAISAYDMNEYFLCDYRPEIAPLGQTVEDLWATDLDFAFRKRVLSQYVRKYVRMIYPTAGRSDGVLVGVREFVRKLALPLAQMESEAGPAIAADGTPGADSEKTGRVSEWSRARVLRRLAVMRASCKGEVGYRGPKRLALERLLRSGSEDGPVVVVVLPISPFYAEEFLGEDESAKFEELVGDLRAKFDEATWITIHNHRQLNDNNMFWDLVHLNEEGQEIATEAVLKQIQLRESSPTEQP